MWSQKPPEAVSDVINFKKFPRRHAPRPPQFKDVVASFGPPPPPPMKNPVGNPVHFYSILLLCDRLWENPASLKIEFDVSLISSITELTHLQVRDD